MTPKPLLACGLSWVWSSFGLSSQDATLRKDLAYRVCQFTECIALSPELSQLKEVHDLLSYRKPCHEGMTVTA